MSTNRDKKILVDFEDAFSSYSGIPVSLINDTACLVFNGFELILWYNDALKKEKIYTWMSTYFTEKQRSKIHLLDTRPNNFKMWIFQIFPVLFRQSISCDYVYTTHFPQLPIKGKHKKVLRIYDPFVNSKNDLNIRVSKLYSRKKLKVFCAKKLRTYSYFRMNKKHLIKIYSSQATRNLWQSIYGDVAETDMVIYPTLQFAIEDASEVFRVNGSGLDFKKAQTRLIGGGSQLPYFIFIGGQRQKKDPLSIINLWAEKIDSHNFDLVLIGKLHHRKLHPLVENSITQGRLRIFDNLDTQDLRMAIENSLGVVYNTLPDGFGYPVAEGLYLLKPVICNDLEIFREIGGNLPYFFESGDMHQALKILSQICEGVSLKVNSQSHSFDLSQNLKNWNQCFLQN
jgi:hypothetical protein